MQPEHRDPAYLWDMLDAARAIVEFAGGVELDAYLKDRKLQAAVERQVEIIGEAARRVSQAFKDEHPEVPWRTIVAQRNVLAHEYGDIRQDRMWALVTERIPALILQVRALLPPEDPETPAAED